MKLRKLMILPFICLVSCGTPKDQVVGGYFYEYRQSPTLADYIVFSVDKTKLAINDHRGNYYYTVRFDNDKIYGHFLNGNEEYFIGKVINSTTIYINPLGSKIVSGEYELTNVKFKGERK